MTSQLQPTQSISRVDAPCLLYGGVGLCLAVAMQVAGLFKGGDERLMNTMLDPVFHGLAPEQLPLIAQVLISAMCSFGIAFVVLDSAGTWRRVVLGVTLLVLTVAMVPTLAVWNVYFSPFLPVVAVFWAWFFCMMYVRHYLMPCEMGKAAPPQSILTVSSAYKTPPVQSTPSVKDKLNSKAVSAIKPSELEKEEPEHLESMDEDEGLKKYQPKPMKREKMNG